MPASPSTPQIKPLRVAVVGGGIIGLSVALELRMRGADVAVYDGGYELGAGASMRAAGMLGVAFEWASEGENRALVSLARHAGAIWPDFVARIERLGGGSVELSRNGAIVVARDESETGWLEAMMAACQARGLAVQRLTAASAGRLEPRLAQSIRASLLLPDDHQVDAQLVLQRLGAAVSRQGVALKLSRKVARILVSHDFRMEDGDAYDRVILATGVGNLPQFHGLRGARLDSGLPRPVPVKGQMLALAPVERGPRHVIHARDLYIAPKGRWILVGSTTERGRGDTVVERAVIDQLRDRAAAILPDLASAPEVAAWAGVRPGAPDNAPLIGPTAISGVFAALGHYRNGVLLAPATAGIIADLVIDGAESPLANAFAPLRFDKHDEAPHSPSAVNSDN